MNRKEEVAKMLEELKNAGISRAQIEADLKYQPKYITQQLSKGLENDRFYNSIKDYYDRIMGTTPTVAKSNHDGMGVLKEGGEMLVVLGRLSRSLEKMVATREVDARSMEKLADSRLLDSQTINYLAKLIGLKTSGPEIESTEVDPIFPGPGKYTDEMK